MTRYLLDTNIVVAHFANDAAVDAHLTAEAEIYVPVIVIGELYYGAENSGRAKANRERVNRFASSNNILSCTTETARWYGIIHQRLRSKGRPVPENDMWIAATAMQHNLVLVTRDAHFGEINNLKLERW